MSSLKGNKKHHSGISSCKYRPNSGENASDSNEDDDNEININKSEMVSILDQRDMDLIKKQLTKGGSEELSDDSGDENQSESELLQQIGQDLSSKKQSGKPLNTTLAPAISEIWEELPPKDILLKKCYTYQISSNSKVLQVKKVNLEVR